MFPHLSRVALEPLTRARALGLRAEYGAQFTPDPIRLSIVGPALMEQGQRSVRRIGYGLLQKEAASLPLGVSYMGTKRALAEAVAGRVEVSREGPLLDAFSGMCSVGTSVGAKRPIWNNDLQLFASTVSSMFFCAVELPPAADTAAALAVKTYRQNRSALEAQYARALAIEASALSENDGCSLERLWNGADLADANETRPSLDHTYVHHFPYDLFTSTYAGSYLGVSQSMDVDSIRFSIDHLRRCGNLDDEAHQWLLLALGRAISRSTTSTGHFAQPLRPKVGNLARFVKQRSRNIWLEWLQAIRGLCPLGTRQWRASNRSLRRDACDLLASPPPGFTPAVIYADPPYTKDQYSRYYHLYETLILYDYPLTSGVGRYRPDRAVSNFSTKAGVYQAFHGLISCAAKLGSDLIISYPGDGLLARSREAIPDLMQAHFKRVDKPIEMQHVHSTMGGSKGEASSVVTEVLYRASAW